MKPEKIQRFARNAQALELDVQGTLHGGGVFSGPVTEIGDEALFVEATPFSNEHLPYHSIDTIGFVFEEAA